MSAHAAAAIKKEMMKMKKLMNLNKRATVKTKFIIFAIVLSSIVTYAELQNSTESPVEQTAEKYEMAQPQPASAAPWENGTNQKQLMPEEKIAQISTHTQKAMKNPEITVVQSQQAQIKPALPLNQKDSVAKQESTEPDTQSSLSTAGSENGGLTSMNNLLYIGILLVVLLAVFIFLQGRKAKNTGQGKK
jgi:preprotein translocase subunit SecG